MRDGRSMGEETMRVSVSCMIAAATWACVAALPASAEDQSAVVQRGAYLVEGPLSCGNCHNTRDKDGKFIPGMEFAGGFHLVDPNFDVYMANITPDKETGIGTWSDEEIIRAIREGKDKEGKIIFPPMPVPAYNSMSDDDVKAVVAYLHTIKPVRNEVKESKWNIPQEAMPPAKGLPVPPKTDTVAYGGYIVNSLAECLVCHSSPDAHGIPDVAHKMGAGGFEITLAPGVNMRASNITSDKDTGIGNWTDADIKKAITDGLTPTGGHLSPPMPYSFYKNMTAEDLDAVVAYIRTVPPIKNQVERTDFQKKAFP
jgi:mono/diheme cytochrome c family protein